MLKALSFIPEHAETAVILCHGYGADGADLFELKASLLGENTSVAFCCPDAPTPLLYGGYEWFSLDDYQPESMITPAYLALCNKRAQAGSVAFKAYLKQLSQETGIPRGRMIIGGFSQGGLIAALTAFDTTDEKEEAPAGLIMMSAVPILPREDFTPHHLPVLITHGLADPVVPPEAQHISAATLKGLGSTPTLLSVPGLGHGIDEACQKAAAAFIRKVFQRT